MPELDRDIAVGAALVVHLDERGAVLVAEHPQRLLDLPRGEHPLEGLVDERAVVDRRVRDRERGPHRPGAREVDHDVADDREQPRAQRTELVVEPVGGPPGAHEGLLHGFLGQAPVAQRPHGEAVQLRAVRGVHGANAVVGRQHRLRVHYDTDIAHVRSLRLQAAKSSPS